LINSTSYYVYGVDARGRGPKGVFPTVEAFVGAGGRLDSPESLIQNATAPIDKLGTDDGKEALGGLQFASCSLRPGQSTSYTLFLGIDRNSKSARLPLKKWGQKKYVLGSWEKTKRFWREKTGRVQFHSGDSLFNQWIQWVQLQPSLRKIFGCSFLPDFDYGRGGRGWRDLWQDCLALLLASPGEVRDDLVYNYGGVRIDGSNATIIGRKQDKAGKWVPEFIADRNNIVRTWMDHGVWPFLTTLLYINQTGDGNILLEKVPYFRDAFIFRMSLNRSPREALARQFEQVSHLDLADQLANQ
jgi:cellobiose phosphorylase